MALPPLPPPFLPPQVYDDREEEEAMLEEQFLFDQIGLQSLINPANDDVNTSAGMGMGLGLGEQMDAGRHVIKITQSGAQAKRPTCKQSHEASKLEVGYIESHLLQEREADRSNQCTAA